MARIQPMADGPDGAIGKLTFVNRIVTRGGWRSRSARTGLAVGGWPRPVGGSGSVFGTLSRVSKLASSENPLDPSPLALEAIAHSMSGLNLYPDGDLVTRL